MATVTRSQLLDAAKSGDLNTLITWKEQNEGDINNITDDTRGNTLLHVACKHGKLKCVEYLVGSANANINIQNNVGDTPIHVACAKGHLECAEYLLGAGKTDIVAKNNNNQTPFDVAEAKGRKKMVKSLINTCFRLYYQVLQRQQDQLQQKEEESGKLRLQLEQKEKENHEKEQKNGQLRLQLEQKEQENGQLRLQLEQKEEENHEKEQESGQLRLQLEQKEEKNRQLQRKLEDEEQKSKELQCQLKQKEENEQLKQCPKAHSEEHKRNTCKRINISTEKDRRQSFQTEKKANTIFLCGQGDEQRSIKANAEVLVVTVPSIETLIDKGIQFQPADDDTDDSTAHIHRTIPLPNLQPKHVERVLQCIYTGEMSFDDNAHDSVDHDGSDQPPSTFHGQHDLQQLLIVANEFGFLQLKLFLEAELARKHLTKEGMIDALLFAHQHNCVVLEDAAMRMAAENENKLFSHPDFSKLSPHHQLMGGIHVLCRGRMKSDGIDDEYSHMSMMELYKVIDEDEGTSQVDLDMDRATLVDFVRSIKSPLQETDAEARTEHDD